MANLNAKAENLELDIEGMTCTACARRIEKNLNKLEGVSAYVDFASEKAHVIKSAEVAESAIVQSIVDSGYSVGSNRSELTILIWRVLVGIAFALPLAVTSMVHEWMLDMRVSALLALPVVTFVAWPFHSAAAKNLRHGSSTMDTLVSLGVLVAFGYSLYSVIVGSHEVYFEVAAVVPTVVLIGRWLEVRTRRSATDSVRALLSAIPETANVRRDGMQQSVPASSVVRGDLVVVAAGERVPVDGIVVEGSGSLDNSLITGESVPEALHAGSKVAAGALNLSGSFVLRATEVTATSRIAQIADLVREATATKTRITSLTDRVSSIFVPTVILISIGTFAVWFALGQTVAHSLSFAIAVLVIACPCALGIAVPMSLAVATANGAKRGIVIRNPDSLSLLNKVDTVVLDKTGTLTTGQLRVSNRIALGELSVERATAIASALERNSNHPIAKAVAALDQSLDASEVTEHAGTGLTGVVDGKKYELGLREKAKCSNQSVLDAAISEVGAKSLAVLSSGSEALLLIALEDDLREDASAAIEELKAIGMEPVLLSGDVDARVKAVATELEIKQWHARVSPEEKLQILKALEVGGKVSAMVGDGLNDVAALAGSAVGIAMGSGTHAAQSAASVTILDDKPTGIAYALKLSKRTWRNIKQNLAWAFGYNIILIPVAAVGLMNPMLAGTAMAFSSVSVVLNALRLRR